MPGEKVLTPPCHRPIRRIDQDFVAIFRYEAVDLKVYFFDQKILN
jgi:hypothetical protein